MTWRVPMRLEPGGRSGHGRQPTRIINPPGMPEHTEGWKGCSGERRDHTAECRRKKPKASEPGVGPAMAPLTLAPSPVLMLVPATGDAADAARDGGMEMNRAHGGATRHKSLFRG